MVCEPSLTRLPGSPGPSTQLPCGARRVGQIDMGPHCLPGRTTGRPPSTGRSPRRRRVRGLADGSVDIVIGTHRLLQPTIRYKDLGLVVVDEEQRFGVEHKEHITALRAHVDMLTM